MGNKVECKRIAKEAGISIIKGHDGVVPNITVALEVGNIIFIFHSR
jgi:biotin carboxylase